MLDSLVRVSRRVACDHYASILALARSSAQAGAVTSQAVTPPERGHIPGVFLAPPEPMLAGAAVDWAGEGTPEDRPRAPGLAASASLSTISRAV